MVKPFDVSQATSQESLAALHIPLHTVTHSPWRTLPDRVIALLETFKAKQIFGNIEYEVDELRRDIKICELASPLGIKPVFWHDKCVVEPGVVTTKEEKTYTVCGCHNLHSDKCLLAHYLGLFTIPEKLECQS